MKRLDYKNKIVVLTGASSGIGKEIARELITKHSCLIFAIARNEERLNLARNELGENYVPFALDVGSYLGWEGFVDFLKKSTLRVDILINCAGKLPKFASFEETEITELESTISTNFLSQAYSCKLLLPHINDGGAIINVSSASALCPFGLASAYSASKSASYSLSECLGVECERVRVSTALFGFVKTDIMKNQSLNEKEKGLISKFSASPIKATKKLLSRVKRRKRRIVVGADAHFVSFLYRFFPSLAPKIIYKFLKKSGLELFK